MERPRVGLVGCVKSKRAVPAPAADLYTSAYTSALFRRPDAMGQGQPAHAGTSCRRSMAWCHRTRSWTRTTRRSRPRARPSGRPGRAACWRSSGRNSAISRAMTSRSTLALPTRTTACDPGSSPPEPESIFRQPACPLAGNSPSTATCSRQREPDEALVPDIGLDAVTRLDSFDFGWLEVTSRSRPGLRARGSRPRPRLTQPRLDG